jgi:hypothetical protein
MYFQAHYRKLLVKNRIDAYDMHQNLGTSLQALKISDAITLCSDAWKAVTAETIKNCWLKTGILPISEDAMEIDTGSNNQQVGDLQNLIDELNTIETSDKLDATEFITIDNDDSLEYGGTEVTDEEIISCVRPTSLETEQEEEEGIPQTITTAEVLKSLDTVISYVKNPPQNLVFELKHINSINEIKNRIGRYEIDSRKQATLERWFR